MAGANEVSARLGKAEKRGAPGKKKEKIGLTSEPSPQVLGYICVSVGGPNDDTQRRALLAAGVAESNIYCDSLVAPSDVRTALAGCSERLREGDSIVLWTLNAFDENEGKVNLIVQGLAYRGILIRTLSTPEVPLSSSEEPQKSVPKTARISNLDALRGFAAIAVVVFHAIIILNFELALKLLATPIYKINNFYDLTVKTMLVFFNGGVAVALFFILSGAVLFRSLQSGNSFNYLAARNFTVSRVLRIYPMLVAALVLLYAIVNMSHAFLPTMFPVSYRANDFMQNLILANPSMHGASWTLQIEMIAIPVILLLYAGWRFGGITVLLLAVLYSSLATFVAINHHTESLSLNSALLRECLLYFSLGMLVATAEMRLFVQRLPGRVIWAIFVIMLFSRHVIEDLSTGILVTAYCACILVAWLYHGESISFLTRRIPLWLGRISYSVYLLNVMIMILIMQMLYWMNEPLVRSHYLEFGILLSVVTVAFTLPLASWTERWIEKPFINFGKQLNARAARGGTILRGLRQEAAPATPIAVH